MTNRTPFEQIALLMQGGGALGAYQAGVYQALAEADLHPDWVARISIGAINSEFSRRTMEEHWSSGYRNARKTLANPEVLQLPDREEGVRTFDISEE